MGKRREPRVKLDVPVKVCGMDTAGHPFVQTAYAISISRSGVRLTGVGPLVRVGETVAVLYKNRKARFKVVWIAEMGQPEAGQAGLQAVDPNALLWDFALPHPGADGYVSPNALNGYSGNASTAPPTPTAPQTPTLGPRSAAKPATAAERRNAMRLKCRGSADIYVPNVSFPTRGQIDDISLSGVYIQTTAPLLVGSTVTLQLAIQGYNLKAEAEVRTAHPGVGMGLMFTNMTTENRMTLGAIVNRLSIIPGPAGVPSDETVSAAAPATAASVLPAGTPPPVAPLSSAPPQNQAFRSDAIGRAVSNWFESHDMLSKAEFLALLKRL